MSGNNHLTQELKQEQGLNLSPIQLLASRLVELTNLELAARIEHELEDNPALEEGSSEEKLKDETYPPISYKSYKNAKALGKKSPLHHFSPL